MEDEKGYDLNSISRFLETVHFNRPSSNPSWLAHAKSIRKSRGFPDLLVTVEIAVAAAALQDVLWGVDLHKTLKLHKKPTKKSLTKTIDNPKYSVVMALLNNEIEKKEALSLLMGIENYGQRSAEEYYYSVKPDVEITLKSIIHTYKYAGLGEFKVMINKPRSKEEEVILLVHDNNLKHTARIKMIQSIMNFSSFREAQQYLLKLIK